MTRTRCAHCGDRADHGEWVHSCKMCCTIMCSKRCVEGKGATCQVGGLFAACVLIPAQGTLRRHCLQEQATAAGMGEVGVQMRVRRCCTLGQQFLRPCPGRLQLTHPLPRVLSSCTMCRLWSAGTRCASVMCCFPVGVPSLNQTLLQAKRTPASSARRASSAQPLVSHGHPAAAHDASRRRRQVGCRPLWGVT